MWITNNHIYIYIICLYIIYINTDVAREPMVQEPGRDIAGQTTKTEGDQKYEDVPVHESAQPDSSQVDRANGDNVCVVGQVAIT